MPLPGDLESGAVRTPAEPVAIAVAPAVAAPAAVSAQNAANAEPARGRGPDPFRDPPPGAEDEGAGNPDAESLSTGNRGPSARTPGRLTDRIRGWAADRLPDPLKGHWRMDHRVGTVLAAVAVVGALGAGGYALWAAQPEQKPQQFAVNRSADQSYDKSLSAGDESSDSASDSASDTGSDSLADTSAAGGSMPMPTSASLPGSGFPADTSAGTGISTGIGTGTSSSTSAGIMVDVEGKVLRPGVQQLPAGARVLDALMMAGGALPGTDLSNLDQARVLGDGEQLMVGPGAGAGAVPAAGSSAPATKGRTKAVPSAPIRLNTATLDQLEELPGVGPALAQRVLDWRTGHGGFASVQDLQQVKGFGPHKFAAVRALVTL